MKNKLLPILLIWLVALTFWVSYICYRELDFNPDNSAGIFVSALGVIIAFVTGWTIWKTIEARNTINDFEKRTEDLFSTYENKIVNLLKGITGLMDALAVMSETIQTVRNGIGSTRNKIGFNWTYKVFASALRDIIKSDLSECEPFIDCCLDNMEECLKKIEAEKINYEELCVFDGSLKSICDDCYREIINSKSDALNHKRHIRIEELNKRRQSFTK